MAAKKPVPPKKLSKRPPQKALKPIAKKKARPSFGGGMPGLGGTMGGGMIGP